MYGRRCRTLQKQSPAQSKQRLLDHGDHRHRGYAGSKMPVKSRTPGPVSG